MITAFLQGGIGNQLFQIAAAYSLSRDIGTECIFDFDQCFTPAQGNKSFKYRDNIFKKIKNQPLNLIQFNKYNQPRFAYTELPKIDNLMIVGDFQSEKYFLKYKQDVLNLFDFNQKRINEIETYLKDNVNNSLNVTAVHVRRGDYLTKPNYHPTCSVEYYKKAMSMIDNNSKFIFISDDLNWCKENFKGDNIFYSPFTNEIDDLYLIMSCKNHIIANSSFSWWGTYLSKNKNKVICPSVWFGQNGPQDTWDIYLNNWIKI